MLVPLFGPRLMLGGPQLFHGGGDPPGPACLLAPPVLATSTAEVLPSCCWEAPERTQAGSWGKDIEVLPLCGKW